MSCKSVLYVPGNNSRAIEKARSLEADAIIFDLEDSVTPEQKQNAREAVAQALKDGGYNAKLLVRVNGLETPWANDDMAIINAEMAKNIVGIVMPKVEKRQNVTDAEQLMFLHHLPSHVSLWAMVETPLAIANVDEIATAGNRLSTLVFGTNDLKNSMSLPMTDHERDNIGLAMQQVIVAAKANGLAAIDGVFNAFKDNDGFLLECAEGAKLGFDGKSLIHPSQIEGANNSFKPSADEVDTAKELIAAFEQGLRDGKGVIEHRGQMVEALHVEQAKRLVAKSL